MKFRKLVLAVALAGAVTAPPVMAQQSPQLSAAEATVIKAAVAEAANTYFRFISDKNVKGVVEKSFIQPSITIGASGVSLRAPEQQTAQFEANKNGYWKAAGTDLCGPVRRYAS